MSAAWGVLVVVLYASLLRDVAPSRLRVLYEATREFFLWQAAGFLLACAITSIWRPGLVGRICALYLGASTLVLLAFSRDPWLAAAFAVFLTGCFLAVGSTRLAIRSLIGIDQATWGLAAGAFFAVLVPLSFLLGCCGLMSRWPVALVAVAIGLPAAIRYLRHGRREVAAAAQWVDSLTPVGAAALGAAWLGLAVAFVWANAPETESDAMRQHIPYMQQLARAGGFELQHLDFQRLMVYGLRAVFTTGYVLGSMQVARWMSWFSVVALLMLVTDEVSRRSAHRNLGILAGAAITTVPIFLSLSRTLYHDHVITLLCVAAFISLFRGLESSSRRGVAFSACIMGCAVQSKYNVLVFAVVWIVFLIGLAVKKYGPARGLKQCVPPLVCLAVVGCPWYLYTFIKVGNPVYPYLNETFGSPYWPAGKSTEFNHADFQFDGGVKEVFLFPWSMTFHSSKIDQPPDGRLGYLLLALLPFALTFFDRRCRSGSVLGLAGLAGFLCICWRTEYARYWLPMYPLIVVPLFLALGEAVRRARWRPRPTLSSLLGVGVFAALLVTLPVLGTERFGPPWDVYTRKTSAKAWMAAHFAGLPAVLEAQNLWEPSDRVLATGYHAVFTIDAEAYSWPYWLALLAGLRNPDSLDDFLARNDVRFWVVDHAGRDAVLFAAALDAEAKYWTDSNLVAGSSTVGVYSIAPASPATSVRIHHETVAPTTEDLPNGAVGYEFSVPEGADSCRIRVELLRPQGAILSLRWLDEAGRTIERSGGSFSESRPRLPLRFFAAVPEQARYGRFLIRPWKSESLYVGKMELGFWRRAQAP